jgi:ribonucleoside-diphosphate reductase alpha chain
MISCGGGGLGFNFSYIRPKGEDIGNVKHSAPGAVSNMKMINEVGNHVKAGKSRRTALIAILNVTHPDLFEFLTVKLDNKELNNTGNINLSKQNNSIAN